MNEDYIFFGGDPRLLKELTVADAVKLWESDSLMFEACTEAPEIAWPAILEILERNLTDEQKALLAAGPLEDLLSWHGADFIDRVEQTARQNARFNDLLGGVWQNGMPPEIWGRIELARKRTW